MIAIKSEQEIAVLRSNGKLLASVLAEVAAVALEGVSTLELDQLLVHSVFVGFNFNF